MQGEYVNSKTPNPAEVYSPVASKLNSWTFREMKSSNKKDREREYKILTDSV